METEKNTQHDHMQENEVIKDRSLRFMVIGLGMIILIMGYLTLYVDDISSFLSKKEEVVTVIDDNNSDVLVENSSMSDEEVRASLIKFIEAFYNDQKRGYFDPPSYFSSITRTYYNYHNLTYKRLKEVHLRRLSDMQNYNLQWIVSSLDYDRNDTELLATYRARVKYLQPSHNAEVSADITYEMAINEEGKIVSLRETEISNLVESVFQTGRDSFYAVESGNNPIAQSPEKVAEPLPEPLESTNPDARYEGKLYDLGSVEIAPEYQGGQSALGKYLGLRLRYPVRARENKIQGKVYIGFIVEKNGSLSDFKIVRGIGGGCDEEAIRVLRSGPAWKAGMVKGKAVRTSYVLPITFQLGN
ncbi:MAG: energy transducer TonB [Pedobacter sp.]